VAQGAVLGSWAVVAFGSERDLPTQSIQAFIRELVITCQDNGMVLNKFIKFLYDILITNQFFLFLEYSK
jgi:hypothetical protein